jgi:hypothetical protein
MSDGRLFFGRFLLCLRVAFNSTWCATANRRGRERHQQRATGAGTRPGPGSPSSPGRAKAEGNSQQSFHTPRRGQCQRERARRGLARTGDGGRTCAGGRCKLLHGREHEARHGLDDQQDEKHRAHGQGKAVPGRNLGLELRRRRGLSSHNAPLKHTYSSSSSSSSSSTHSL